MNAIVRTSLLATGLLTLATSAFAAGSSATGGGLLIWLFLGFFGLIVATQLVPALLLMVGIAKGVAGHGEATEAGK